MTTILMNPGRKYNGMSTSEISQILAFPDEPLDDKDRQILVALRNAGPQGLGFNLLVEKVRDSVSRSTVAVRIEKLVRLGYVTKKQGDRAGKSTPISLSRRSESLFAFIDSSKEMSKKVLRELEEFEANNFNKEEFEGWYARFSDGFNSTFGMAAFIAVLFGRSAAGNLFIPLLMDNYSTLFAKLTETIRKKPGALTLFRSLIDTKLEMNGTSVTQIRDKIKGQIDVK